jgi:hypothetical protein
VFSVSRDWAQDNGWQVVAVATLEGKTVVRFSGSPPMPEVATLRAALATAGVDVTAVRAEFIPAESVDFGEPSG